MGRRYGTASRFRGQCESRLFASAWPLSNQPPPSVGPFPTARPHLPCPRHCAARKNELVTSDALPVTDEEFERLVAECRTLLPAVGGYTEDDFGPYDDYITNVLLTVLDLQMHNVAVDNSIKYYWNNRWHEIRQLGDLRAVVDRFPDTPEGNREAAQYLWGNKHWTRIGWLRGFVAFLEQESLTTQEQLREWANACDYERDFRGRVKYLGIAACQWLRMRLGVDTVKPDVHTHNFVKHAIGRPLSDTSLVKVIEAAARALNVRARRLDGAIWEHQRGAPGTI
jgi:hypothetical protein